MSTYNSGCSFWIELLKLTIPSVLVIMGWIVANSLAKNRERDKARRDIITKSVDSLYESIDKIFEIACQYHLGTRDIKLETKLKMNLQDLTERISSITEIAEQDSEVSVQCINSSKEFRQAITSVHFEDEHLEPFKTESELESISATSFTLKRSLIRLKHAQYPPPIIYR